MPILVRSSIMISTIATNANNMTSAAQAVKYTPETSPSSLMKAKYCRANMLRGLIKISSSLEIPKQFPFTFKYFLTLAA